MTSLRRGVLRSALGRRPCVSAALRQTRQLDTAAESAAATAAAYAASPRKGPKSRVISEADLLHRSRTFATTEEDVCLAIDHLRAVTGREPNGGLAAPMDASLNATVDVPLNRPGGASKALQATSLYQCLLYRVIVTFARWHVVRKADLDDVDESEHIPEAAAHVPKDATAEDIAPQEYEMPPMLTLEGETPNERVVMACTATKGFDVLKQWHPSYAFECLAGYSLVEETFNLAESADVKETDNTVVGITVDPDPEADRWTLLSSGDDLPHLEFFARCAKVEAALHSWCSLVHTMEQGDDISKGHIADDGSTHTLSIAVQVLARHPRYWTLKIGGDDVSSKGYLFLFTAPDLALGHYLEARASNPHIPQMVPAQLSTGGVRKLLRVNEAMAGIWFNPRVDPRVSMETKIDRFALLNLIRVVDLYGYSVLPGW